jgi:TfoX N-terminal domain
MAYDEALAERVRDRLADEPGLTEKKMFGGLAFLLEGNMAVGLTGTDGLLVRLGPDDTEAALARPHTRLFGMGGRTMKGWIVVAAEGVAEDDDLARWVDQGVAYARSLPPKR